MNFLLNCLKGMAIGAGAILPGISSGVFCVIFGIYEKLLDSILNFFSDIKNNVTFLLPIVIGGFFGVILLGNVLNYCLYTFPIQTKSLFIGLILASIPPLIKQIPTKKRWKPINLVSFFLALLVGIVCIFLENFMPNYTLQTISIPYLILCGFLMSIGVVVPGVSNTIILMLLGVYPIYLNSVSNLYFPILIPLGIGLVIGGFFFMKLTKYLLDSFFVPTFSGIIGFTVGSIFVLLPSFSSSIDVLIGALCVFLGFYMVKLFQIS